MNELHSAQMNAAFHMEKAVHRLELAFRYLVEARMLDQSGDIDLCIGTIRAAIHSLGGSEDRSCETCSYSVDDDCTAGDGECWPPSLALWQEKQDDFAFLLDEVKRLEGEVSEDDGVRAVWRRRTQESEALALSLAEALERGRDYLAALEENIIRNDVDMHIDACPPPSAVARDMSAALSSPALLKLKGAV